MKKITKLTDAELLEILENSEELETDSEIQFDSSVLSFVQNFNIKPGKDRIIKKQLFRLYKVWNKGVQKISQSQFTSEISHLIDHRGNFYLINSDMFQIAKFIEDEKKRNKQNKSKSKAWHRHFTAFLTDTKLEAGNTYIELEILYFLYMQWRRKAKKEGLIGRVHFTQIAHLYFDLKQISIGDAFWVGVNEQIKNLITKSEIQRWRKTRGKEKKYYYRPQEEWKKFALYWEEKEGTQASESQEKENSQRHDSESQSQS
jgi:hypothetical protein